MNANKTKIAELTEIRESLKAELETMGFDHPGRDYRVSELVRVRRIIDELELEAMEVEVEVEVVAEEAEEVSPPSPVFPTAAFHCSTCHADKPVQTDGGTGYATDRQGMSHCYDCCAVLDRIAMRDEDRTTLYLSDGVVGNWCGTLKLIPCKVRNGRHNIGRTRVDVWFREDEFGSEWHGVNIGDSEILHCRKLKSKAGKAVSR
jgi:hypothetical protein